MAHRPLPPIEGMRPSRLKSGGCMMTCIGAVLGVVLGAMVHFPLGALFGLPIGALMGASGALGGGKSKTDHYGSVGGSNPF